MNMQIDKSLVKQLRIKESLSQEMLAERAGLSLRTIQRVEKDGVAAPQTRAALANVLNVTAASLQISQTNTNATTVEMASVVSNSPLAILAKVTNYYHTFPFRFIVLTGLVFLMTCIMWLAFTVLIEGIFYITHTEVEVGYWQNLGNAIIGSSFFAIPLLILHWLYGKIGNVEPISKSSK